MGVKMKKRTDFSGFLAAAKERVPWAALLPVCALILSAVPAVYINGLFGYMPVFLVALGIILSFIYLRLIRTKLSFSEYSVESMCERGTEMNFVVELKNESRLIFPKIDAYFYVSDLFGGDASVTRSVLTLSSKETRQYRFSVKFDHIGQYTAGLRALEIYDIFGLMRHRIDNGSRYEIDVLPRVHDLQGLEITEHVQSESIRANAASSAESIDYAGVRDYAFGDPIKNIHWKLSAHSRGYMTKIMESYGNTGLTAVMDMAAPQCDEEAQMYLFDGIVESAVSVCSFAKERGMDYDIKYLSRSGEKRKAAPADFLHLQELIRDIPRIYVSEDDDTAVRLLSEEGRSMYGRSNIVFCTSRVTDDLVQLLIRIKSSGRNPMLFFVIPRGRYREDYASENVKLHSLELSGVPYYFISADPAKTPSFGGL